MLIAKSAASAVLLSGCGVLLGCSSVQLVPLVATRGSQAWVVSSGLEVRADAREHPASVPSSFTPVHLSVHNTGAQPIYVALDDIDLAAPGRALDAVPAGNVPINPRVASLGLDPGSPFVIRQHTGGSGPRIGRSESVLLEPHPGSSPTGSAGVDSSRQEIARSAFQGGLIGAGETRQGFVYFRSVPRDAERLTLRVGVRGAPESAPASVVEIAYAVRS
jgi:hypothetical protein